MRKSKFLKPFSDVKVWLHWVIIATVVSFLFFTEIIPMINVGAGGNEITAIFIIGVIYTTLAIAVTDVVVEKLLGV